VQDSPFDAIKDGLHAAEGVVVSEVELSRRLVAFPDDLVAAVPSVLYLPLRRIFLGTVQSNRKECKRLRMSTRKH
jgi:hypothetical protein